MAVNFLPEDKLPEYWNDEARINVLFAPFRDKSVNPKDWEFKLEFWKNLIYSYCTYNQVYFFTQQELGKIFMKNGRSPACLGIVIEQLYRDGNIKPLDSFLQKSPESWGKWIVDSFVRKPVVWSFTKIKSSIITTNANIAYAHLNAIETASQELLDNIPANMKNKIIELKSLAEHLHFNNHEQLNILIHDLYCKRRLSVKILQNGGDTITLIKFHDVNGIKGIIDKDIDIYTLRRSEETLVKDIEKLEKQVIQLISDAKRYLSKSQRQSAKLCLRKKKEIEKIIEKRANTLFNVQTLLSTIEDTYSDSEILDSYKIALSRLRATFNETGLSEESVSNTMLELEEVLEIHDGIHASLAQENITVDSDIEKELEELLEYDNKKDIAEPSKKLENLDDVNDLQSKLASLKLELPSPPRNDLNKEKISL
ncbi:hypothetical protein AMK59_5143 [Oryctes borbonicus]|uniref:Charged multivesicular body protein 7 n=1 Tax=Oryctes borbonicus TaxID=1629725 RepID=A0A0T6B2C5_9SCAR|nr:hypothetical protein AMK59_5143 [Oryctes borbonicus]